jgi:hypothetical protein
MPLLPKMKIGGLFDGTRDGFIEEAKKDDSLGPENARSLPTKG